MTALRLLFVDYEIPYLVKEPDQRPAPVGGAAVDLLCLIDELLAQGHEVGVLSWKGARKYLNGAARFELFECDLRRPVGRSDLSLLPDIARAVYHVRRYRPDYIIQKCAGGLTGVVAILARICGVPFVYRCASNIDVDAVYIRKMAMIRRLLYRHGIASARIVFCQNGAQYRAIKSALVDKRVVVIHDFYNGPYLAAPVPPSERQYIAWIGRFDPYKNLPRLVEIVRAFPGRQFRIAGGSSGSCDSETHCALSELQRCANVRFVGNLKRNAIVPFLSRACVLLNTSHVEGFPRTFLEALAAGTPIVAPQFIDPDNIVEKNDLGAVAPDMAGLGAALQALLERSDYPVLADRCVQYVLERHGAESLVTRFVEALASASTT